MAVQVGMVSVLCLFHKLFWQVRCRVGVKSVELVNGVQIRVQQRDNVLPLIA
jgi:hypothetical protein